MLIFSVLVYTSAQYKECVNEQERLTSCLSECQRQYQQSHQELKALNTKVHVWVWPDQMVE